MSTRRPLDIITAINLTRKYEYKDASHKKINNPHIVIGDKRKAVVAFQPIWHEITLIFIYNIIYILIIFDIIILKY